VIDNQTARKNAKLLAAVADSHRIQIIDCLRTGSKNVTELATLMGEEIVNVSHHLSILRAAGLVEDVKKGRFVIYTLHPAHFALDDKKVMYIDLGWCRIEIPHFSMNIEPRKRD
jgi:ArsR family transcriptional regulator